MKSILFKTDMVRAILDGRKTVTRRVVKPQPFAVKQDENASCWCGHFISENGKVQVDKPPYRPGDILYVRETWCPLDADHVIDGVRYAYKAGATPESERVRKDYGYKWRPSIHMPREAARIFLRVTDVRVERLQDITEIGAEKEGLRYIRGYGVPKYGSKARQESDSDAVAAVGKLANLGVINSPDYWRQAVKSGEVKYLDALLVKAVVKITRAGQRSSTPENGIGALVSAGVIDTPDYWLEHYRDYPNLGDLLCALGGAVK